VGFMEASDRVGMIFTLSGGFGAILDKLQAPGGHSGGTLNIGTSHIDQKIARSANFAMLLCCRFSLPRWFD